MDTTQRYVLFDFDGTIADSAPAIVALATKVLHSFGMTDEQIGDATRLVGPPFPYAFVEVYGMDPKKAQAVADAFRQEYVKMGADASPAYPGMPETIQKLHDAGYRLGLATSKYEDMAQDMLDNLGILQYFDVVSGKHDDEHASKTFVIAEALREFGLARNEVANTQIAMVGDRKYDIEGAHSFDIPCVAVMFGTTDKDELVRAGAEAIVQTPDELFVALEEICSR